MHRLVLHNLGPVKDCEINVNDFMVFTGPQANGKSTIAKAVFFFRTIKDDILDLIMRGTMGERKDRWTRRVEKRLRSKFLQLFGSSYGMSDDMRMEYHYTEDVWLQLSLTLNKKSVGGRNYVKIEFSPSIKDYLDELDMYLPTEVGPMERDREKERLERLFADSFETIFIPAGRSMITLLTSQINYIFTSMETSQKSAIDYATQRYVELILKLKPAFSGGIAGLLSDKLHTTQTEFNVKYAYKMKDSIERVLKGRYQYNDGEERLYLSTGRAVSRYVKINFASSGQQETVWITNLLFYYLIENRHMFLIVEEPESNLYPDAQKQITELLSLFRSAGNQVLITTHSPYVLGTLNNLIYASDIAAEGTPDVEKVIDRELWLNRDAVSAWHMGDGEPKPATEPEMGLIRNEYIEGASEEINREGDKLYEISAKEE